MKQHTTALYEVQGKLLVEKNTNNPHFILADTVWMAFAKATLDEWGEYLEFRKGQGFNGVQLQFFPSTHDSSMSPDMQYPFYRNSDGSPDYSRKNEAYFRHAHQMCAMAEKRGFTLLVAPVWANCIPGTWAAKRVPGDVMPFGVYTSYIDAVVDLLGTYNTIFIVGGDTDFPEDSSAYQQYYEYLLQQVKCRCPQRLTTFHMHPRGDLPDRLMENPYLDLYMYQSGHMAEEQNNCFEFALKFSSAKMQRPIINGEPAYEGHGLGFRYGRHSAFHVRRAFWYSVLSGAKSGFTYGAHGLWSWHRPDDHFTGVAFSGTPFYWRDSLKFAGATQLKRCLELISEYGILFMDPVKTPEKNFEEIRIALCKNRCAFAVYLPYATNFELPFSISRFQIKAFALNCFEEEPLCFEITEEKTMFRMQKQNSDYLILGKR